MQLAEKTANKPVEMPQKGKTAKTKRRPSKSIKPTLERREGRLGRPSLYPGKDVSRHATSYMTPEGWRKLGEVQDALLKRNETLNKVTVSDAMEAGIHRIHTELTRLR